MKKPNHEEERQYLAVCIPIGAGAGVALGVVLMNILDHPGFMAVGIAVGLCLGVVIGLVLDLREE